MNIDRIDLNILMHLQLNGRITNTRLADLVGLSASPCLTRVKRLEQAGYITGYRAIVDRALFGEGLNIIAQVTLVKHQRAEASRFEVAVCAIPQVVDFHMVNGRYDYIIKFAVKDIDFYRTTMETLVSSGLGVREYNTFIVEKDLNLRIPYPIDGAR